jgi:hypothetical protein
LNRSTIKPVKPVGFGFGSTVFKTLVPGNPCLMQRLILGLLPWWITP